jgi:hypothetical protein
MTAPDTPTRRRMGLVAFKAMVKGSLVGFADVRLPSGLEIHDCAVLTSNGKSWAALPAKPVLDRDGRQIIDANGKKKFVPILSWPDRATADAWSDRVVDLVRAEHPEAFDGSGR